MTLFVDRLKELSAFIYILIFLLVFNLFFNLNYNWYGISLIVRIYLFVFSFYMIFDFTSIKIKSLKEEYYNRFGISGEYFLFFQVRLLPFILIYLITILFGLIDYIRLPDWPWNPVLSLLNGRYSNTIIYSLFLLIILKLRREPRITIPFFLLVSVLYFFLDKYLYSTATSGMAISAIKIIKFLIFFLVLFYEFFNRKLVSIIGSLLLSIVIFALVFYNYLISYNYTRTSSYIKKEAGLQLVRFGYTRHLEGLKDIVLKTSDFDLFRDLLHLAIRYDMEIRYDDNDWKRLLFSAPDDVVELISQYISNRNINLSYNEIIGFMEARTMNTASHLEEAVTFNKIFLRYIKGNEDDLIERMKNSNKNFKIWGMEVLGENKSIAAIPLLINLLTDIDISVAEGAYNALKKITLLDPVLDLNKKKNDPDVIIVFKKYYLQHRFSGTGR